MAIVKMKRLKALGMAADRQELLKRLRSLGCVEIRAPEDVPEDWDFLAPPGPKDLDRVNTQLQELEAALTVLKTHGAKGKGGLLTPRPQLAEAEFFDPDRYRSALAVARELNEDQRKLTAHQSQRAKLAAGMAALEPWLELPVPLDFEGTRQTRAWFVSVPKNQPRETVTEKLDAATELYDLTWCGADKESQYFFLLCHDSADEEVQSALLDAGCTRLNLKNWSGTAAECHRALEQELSELDGFIQGRQSDIQENMARQEDLQMALERARQDAELERSKLRLLDSESTFLLEGWLPAEREQTVTEVLNQYGMAFELSDPTQDEYDKVPIQLKNNPVTASMNPITEMYSMPAYDGVDPNPLMAPFFITFFGFMMNDMAYGLLMVLGTALYIKLARPKVGQRNFMMLFLLCGVSTFFWGALTGSFLGDFIPQLSQILGHPVELPHLFTPMDDTIMVMIGSLVLGVIQVFTGMAISVVEKFRHHDPLDALFDEISWWIILGSGAWAILGGGTPALVVLALGGAMLLVGGARKNKGLGKITGAVGIIYNGVSGFFSDILSYVRLMALMLSGSVIASVFNTLGATFNSVIPFVLISLVGNALNLALNLLGCYVHTLRLQCLEFFGRFYKEGGKPFKPLAVDTNYVEVIKGGVKNG